MTNSFPTGFENTRKFSFGSIEAALKEFKEGLPPELCTIMVHPDDFQELTALCQRGYGISAVHMGIRPHALVPRGQVLRIPIPAVPAGTFPKQSSPNDPLDDAVRILKEGEDYQVVDDGGNLIATLTEEGAISLAQEKG